MKKQFLTFAVLGVCGIGVNLYADQSLTQLLVEHNIVRHGDFVLRNGASNAVYVDMRMVFASMNLLKNIAACALKQVSANAYDRICGVPYGAVPLATSMCLAGNKPLLVLRPDAQLYGVQQLIEGLWNQGDRVLVVEDVMTTGKSVLETAEILKSFGLKVTDIIVLVDREQGGVALLKSKGYRIHVLTTLHDLTNCK